MFALQHRIRVFVFRFDGPDARFLLLRHRPRTEWPLGPVVGPVGPGDHLREAVVREVQEETGIARPHLVLDLAEPAKDLFGDCGLIEWPFAYQAGTPDQPEPAITPGPRVGECAWMDFEAAFQSVESQRDRDALVRLRLRLAS